MRGSSRASFQRRTFMRSFAGLSIAAVALHVAATGGFAGRSETSKRNAMRKQPIEEIRVATDTASVAAPQDTFNASGSRTDPAQAAPH
jgi:hypothetical protein